MRNAAQLVFREDKTDLTHAYHDVKQKVRYHNLQPGALTSEALFVS